MKKDKNNLPKWILWITGFIILFGIILYSFYMVEQSAIGIKVESVEIFGEGTEPFLLKIVISFCITLIILGIINLVGKYLKYKERKK